MISVFNRGHLFLFLLVFIMIVIRHVGSLNGIIVHPRDVLKLVIVSNSAFIIVAHNHLSFYR
ncbi:hypothetical protein COJ86_21355 [Bacillus cereus]|nr:hypothetical protein COJ86_21355 [Bacillus cereus]PGU40914.1 hypothetical protein COD91_20850 [Bacillus cereus]